MANTRYTTNDLKNAIEKYNKELEEYGISDRFEWGSTYNQSDLWINFSGIQVRIESGSPTDCLTTMQKKYYRLLDEHDELAKQAINVETLSNFQLGDK